MSMDPTHPVQGGADDIRGQMARILHSAAFSGSEALRSLLSFLAEHTIQCPDRPLKEKEIAIGVFGRSADFDPQVDSIVRVQIGRLRSKLAEYYLREGASDPVVLEIPRGSYHLAVLPRRGDEVESASAPALPQAGKRVFRQPIRGFLGGLLCGTLVAGAVGFWVRWATRTHEAPGLSPEVRGFWEAVVPRPNGPLIVFGNPRFVGSDYSGMRYWRDTDDPRDAVVDTFTTIGDLAGVHEVTRVLAQLGRTPVLKRAQLLTWDEAINRELIIVGSPISIRTLREHPFLQEFLFKDRNDEPRVGVGAIMNRHPAPGEEAIFFGPSSRPYQFDYAVVGLTPGVSASRRALILAGITSHGTQAAAELVCREQQIRKLLDRLRALNTRFPVFFECLLRVRVSGGVPVHSEILSLRVRQ